MSSLGSLALLPREIRDQVYEHVFKDTYYSFWYPDIEPNIKPDHTTNTPSASCPNLSLLLLSKTIYNEASTILYQRSTFCVSLPSSNGSTLRPSLTSSSWKLIQDIHIQLYCNMLPNGIFALPMNTNDSESRTFFELFAASTSYKRRMVIEFVHNKERLSPSRSTDYPFIVDEKSLQAFVPLAKGLSNFETVTFTFHPTSFLTMSQIVLEAKKVPAKVVTLYCYAFVLGSTQGVKDLYKEALNEEMKKFQKVLGFGVSSRRGRHLQCKVTDIPSEGSWGN